MTPSNLPVRVAIIDSDALARRRVGDWLRAQPGVTLLGEVGEVVPGIELIRRRRPQVVFLNPDLAGVDGFEVLGSVPAAERPLTVLLSNNPDQALRAFEFDAVDFLLQPFNAIRLASALERVRRRLDPAATAPRTGPPDRLSVRLNGRILLLAHVDIRFLRARNLKTEIRGGGGVHLVNHPLRELAAKLPPDRFLRVHRSTVVNLDHVRQLRPKAHGDGALLLHDGTEIPYSRTRRRALLDGLLSLHGPAVHRGT